MLMVYIERRRKKRKLVCYNKINPNYQINVMNYSTLKEGEFELNSHYSLFTPYSMFT